MGKKEALLKQKNKLLQAEIESLQSTLDDRLIKEQDQEKKFDDYLKERRKERAAIQKLLTGAQEKVVLNTQERKYLAKSANAAKRALENIRNENKHDIEVHLDEILKLKRLNHQMERRIKSLRNEIEVVKEESIMQRNEDRDAIVEMKKTLLSSNDNVVMLQEKLSHEARMNQIRSDEVDRWKTLYNTEVSEALKTKRILQNKCDALMKTMLSERRHTLVLFPLRQRGCRG